MAQNKIYKSICNGCCGNPFKRVPKAERIVCKFPTFLTCGGMLKCEGFKPITKRRKKET
jgi:hypothetical protein